jgi:hypothetical protein
MWATSSRAPSPPTFRCRNASIYGGEVTLWVMCGRRLISKSFFNVAAALVGCGHVSGLFVRRGWPLALMLSADQVPIGGTHSKMR